MSAFSAAAADEDGDTISALRAENAQLRQSLLAMHNTLEMTARAGAHHAMAAECLRETVIRWAARAEQAEGLLESIGAGGVGSPITQRDTITMPRAVVAQALEMLNRINAADDDRNFLTEDEAVCTIMAIDELDAAIRAALEQPDTGIPASVPAGWVLVPVEPTTEMLDAYVQLQGRFNSARSDWAAMLAAAPQPPAIEQRSRYLDGGSRYKVTHLKTSGYCVIGLPAELLGQWVALVDATDNKHMDSLQPPVATERQYPLPDDLYGGSKDWRAGSYHERVEWLHLGYEAAKARIAELEQPPVVEQPTGSEPIQHDEDLLEQLYWEMDHRRSKTGDERLAFKSKMRFYASKFRARSFGRMVYAPPVSDEMMDLADRLGSEFDSVDPMAWKHLLVYAPQPQGEQEPVAYATHDTEGSLSMLFFDKREAEGYCDDGEEPTPLYAHTQPQGEQEPVAVIGGVWTLNWEGSDPIAQIVKKHGLKIGDKLYTSPQPKRQPLTNEQEEAAFESFWRTRQMETFPPDFDPSRLPGWGENYKPDAKKAWLARAAIERAHGIGGGA
jgi:hypothetical protein